MKLIVIAFLSAYLNSDTIKLPIKGGIVSQSLEGSTKSLCAPWPMVKIWISADNHVYSCTDGIVLNAWKEEFLGGSVIVVESGKIVYTYIDVDSVYVKRGQKISKESVIGEKRRDNKENNYILFAVSKGRDLDPRKFVIY